MKLSRSLQFSQSEIPGVHTFSLLSQHDDDEDRLVDVCVSVCVFCMSMIMTCKKIVLLCNV